LSPVWDLLKKKDWQLPIHSDWRFSLSATYLQVDEIICNLTCICHFELLFFCNRPHFICKLIYLTMFSNKMKGSAYANRDFLRFICNYRQYICTCKYIFATYGAIFQVKEFICNYHSYLQLLSPYLQV